MNGYLLCSKLCEVLASAFWLYESSYLCFWCYSFQMCLYNTAIFGTSCYYWFSPPVVFILITLNSTMCYMFGLVTYILHHILHSAWINRIISDYEHTIIDFLTIQSKCARWCGYQFMLLYLNGMIIFWSYSYSKVYLNISYSFIEMELPLLLIFSANLLKIFAL